MKKYYCLFILLILTIVPLVSAQPPFSQTQSTAQDYFIAYPQLGDLTLNQDFIFNFHVFNESNKVPIDNTSTNCYLHLYSMNGTDILRTQVPHIESDIPNEWEIKVLGGNFSSVGDLGGLIQCYNSVEMVGGVQNLGFQVLTKGVLLDIPQAILYSLMFVVVLFLFSVSVWGGVVLPFENTRNVEGGVISITWKKYLKIFCWGMAYAFLIAIDWIIWNLTYAYSQWSTVSNFFHYIYTLLMVLIIPVFFGICLTWLINFVKDKKIEKAIKRTGLAFNG